MNDLFGHTRGPSGEQLKKEALDLHERKYGDYITWARQQAIEWLAARPEGTTISANDIWATWPPPAEINPGAIGAIFRNAAFIRCGFTPATRPSAHSRYLGVYQLRKREDFYDR